METKKKSFKKTTKEELSKLAKEMTKQQKKKQKNKKKRKFKKIHPGLCEHCKRKDITEIKVLKTLDGKTVFLCRDCVTYLGVKIGLIVKKKNLLLATRNYIVVQLELLRRQYAKERERLKQAGLENRDLHKKRLLAKDNKWLPEQVRDGINIDVRNEVGQIKHLKIYGGFMFGSRTNDVHAIYGVRHRTKFGEVVYFAVNMAGRFLGFVEQKDFDKVLKMPFAKTLSLAGGKRPCDVPIEYKRVEECCRSV